MHRPPAPVLRFVDQVAGDGAEELDFRFSRSVLTEFDVDVVHVLDSQLDALLGTKHAGSFQRVLATRALTRNLRKHRIALVRTLNEAADETALRRDSLARRMLDAATTTFVVFDDCTPTPDKMRTVVVPHAHFRDRFLGYPRGKAIKGRLLCIARGELPRGARQLIAIPRVTATPDVTLRLAGEAANELAAIIRSASAKHSSVISARIERLSDGAQVQEIDAAELVTVPQVDSPSDLQSVFLALSLERPVITPRTPQMSALAAEVGSAWLHLTDGPITATAVDTAFERLRHATEGGPQLDGRDLTTIRASYAAVFRQSAARVHDQ